MIEYCVNGKIDVCNGIKYIKCKLVEQMCPYQRYCGTEKCVKHTDGKKKCKYLKGEF